MRGEIIVRDGKGGKDRVTVLPGAIIAAPLRTHLAKLRVRPPLLRNPSARVGM